MMTRREALQALLPTIGEQIVVAVYSMAFELTTQRPGHPLNYTSIGAMGLASSHGLGLALGNPKRKVIVLDGDGSLLMNLGTLVTIGSVAPDNLYHVLCENRTYDVNGGHPLPGGGPVSFTGLARAAGYRATYEFADPAPLAGEIGAILSHSGPAFISLKIAPRDQATDAPLAKDYPPLYTAAGRAAFKAALAAG